MFKNLRWSAGWLWAFLPAVCLAQPDASHRPAVKVGEVAVYNVQLRADRQSTVDTVTVTAVETDLIKTRHERANRSPAAIDAVSNGEWHMLVSGANGVRYEQPAKILSFPMAVGKAWEAKFQLVALNGAKSRVELDNQVTAWEKVATPAGDFDAFKVEGKGWINGVSWTGAMRVAQTLWYAPSISRIVKSEYKDFRGSLANTDTLVELKEFRPVP